MSFLYYSYSGKFAWAAEIIKNWEAVSTQNYIKYNTCYFLLNALKKENFTGAVMLSGDQEYGFILLNNGKVLQAVYSKNNLISEAALQKIALVFKDFKLEMYKSVEPENVTPLMIYNSLLPAETRLLTKTVEPKYVNIFTLYQEVQKQGNGFIEIPLPENRSITLYIYQEKLISSVRKGDSSLELIPSPAEQQSQEVFQDFRNATGPVSAYNYKEGELDINLIKEIGKVSAEGSAELAKELEEKAKEEFQAKMRQWIMYSIVAIVAIVVFFIILNVKRSAKEAQEKERIAQEFLEKQKRMLAQEESLKQLAITSGKNRSEVEQELKRIAEERKKLEEQMKKDLEKAEKEKIALLEEEKRKAAQLLEEEKKKQQAELEKQKKNLNLERLKQKKEQEAEKEKAQQEEQKQKEENLNKIYTGSDMDVTPPRLVKQGKVITPPAARAAKISGRVFVDVVIDKSGNVIEATFVKGNELLKDAALDAARDCQFSPAMLNGSPVKYKTTIPIEFPK